VINISEKCDASICMVEVHENGEKSLPSSIDAIL
jgi:hypothetical protein